MKSRPNAHLSHHHQAPHCACLFVIMDEGPLTRSDTRRGRLDAVAPRHIRAQAALWVTDLHGPGRSPQLDAQVRRWIDADPRHAAAFELATEAWQRSGDLPALLPASPGPGVQGRACRDRPPPPPDPFDPAQRPQRRRSPDPGRSDGDDLRPPPSSWVCLSSGVTPWSPARRAKNGGPRRRHASHAGRQQPRGNPLRRPRPASHTDRGEAFFTVAKHQSRPFVVAAAAARSSRWARPLKCVERTPKTRTSPSPWSKAA